jgi:hypothetical protein
MVSKERLGTASHAASHRLVAELLQTNGYSLQANRKTYLPHPRHYQASAHLKLLPLLVAAHLFVDVPKLRVAGWPPLPQRVQQRRRVRRITPGMDELAKPLAAPVIARKAPGHELGSDATTPGRLTRALDLGLLHVAILGRQAETEALEVLPAELLKREHLLPAFCRQRNGIPTRRSPQPSGVARGQRSSDLLRLLSFGHGAQRDSTVNMARQLARPGDAFRGSAPRRRLCSRRLDTADCQPSFRIQSGQLPRAEKGFSALMALRAVLRPNADKTLPRPPVRSHEVNSRKGQPVAHSNRLVGRQRSSKHGAVAGCAAVATTCNSVNVGLGGEAAAERNLASPLSRHCHHCSVGGWIP